ncbi:hypothetical protein AaE_011089 [Aphanomyces astaci]|uniref:Tetraspanin n=1 Tax=Aphanomyces astaci TaxID=112090 RepID=A0A6A4ZGY7_APHAT|nr:hypothetical protein AaE_011089 [Aphanomyces astaci]
MISGPTVALNPVQFFMCPHFSMQSLAKVVLVLANIALIGAGAVLIWLGVQSRNGGYWSDIFSTKTATNASTMSTLLMVQGVCAILIAFVGFGGAAWRNRSLLTLYSIFVVLGLLMFVAIAIVGFMSAFQANSWISQPFPADPTENDLATEFNHVYCYAQGGRFCVSASINDAVHTFFPSGMGGDVALAACKAAGVDVNAKTGLVGLCDQVEAKLASVLSNALPKKFKEACATCRQVKAAFGDRSSKSLFEWADATCPLTNDTAIWCAKLFLSKSNQTVQTDKDNATPYTQCRTPVLELWRQYGIKGGVGGVALALLSFIVIAVLFQAELHNGNGGGYTRV